jgi:predicted negative regulator of RcsB-dependent stress response
MRAILITAGFALPIIAAAEPVRPELRDLYFGEALYYADQGLYFDALERLDTEIAQHFDVDEPELDSLQFHIGEAEFNVGDFELNYRMHHRAGRAITAVLEGNVDEEVRNEAAFRLARIHFQKGQQDDALAALARIDGRLPEGLDPEIEFLRANVLLAAGQPADAADTLRGLLGDEGLDAYAEYNLGIALLEDGQRVRAIEQLDRAGQVEVHDVAAISVRDKANLVLGTLQMEDSAFVDAGQSLDRVSLEGPLSNQALLSAGWAAASAGNFERAIVPWTILATREDTDAAVQEARLALPFAYAQLTIYGRAALLYGEALETFDAESDKVEASIESIRKGDFLKALVRAEIRQDRDWVIRLRELPETPETYYLMQLLASHDFQTALQNYLDLEDMRQRLDTWQRSFAAYEDIIGQRRGYYEPLLPAIDETFRALDSRIRLRREQHELLGRRRDDLLTSPRAEFLATSEELALNGQLTAIEQALEGDTSPAGLALAERARRVRGALHFTLETRFHERLTELDRNIRELDVDIDRMTEQYESFVRARQAAVHSFEGYEAPIRRLRTRVDESTSAIELLMARQGNMLERVAVDELILRRDRLANYRDQARFALADSYDRATKARELELSAALGADAEEAAASFAEAAQ